MPLTPPPVCWQEEGPSSEGFRADPPGPRVRGENGRIGEDDRATSQRETVHCAGEWVYRVPHSYNTSSFLQLQSVYI